MLRWLFIAAAATLSACGAATELDDFSEGAPDGGPDAPLDVGPADVSSGVTIAFFSGDIRDDGTSWGRPYSCFDDDVGDQHFYSVVTFDNPTGSPLIVDVLVDWTFDGFLHVYRNFDPERTQDNCIDSNDDFEGIDQSQVQGVRVPAGGSIDIVLSSFSERQGGRYDAFVIVSG